MVGLAKLAMRFIFILPVFIMGCSSLLYYPDSNLYVEEEMMEFKPEDCVLPIKGGEIHGWYFTTPKKPKGVIVFFHGNGQNRSSHIIEVYWLVKEGYNVFAPEYPGYGETDGSPTPENTVETGHSALRYIAKRNPDLPMIVYGQSLGGAVALRTVIDMHKEIPIAMVVANATFLSYKKVGQEALANSWLTWAFQLLPYAVLSDKYAPGDKIAELGPIPLLVIHDKKDPVVPFDLGQDLYKKAAEPKEFWTLENGRHTQPFAGPEGLALRKRFLDKLSNLGNRYPTTLKPDAPPTK